MTVKLNIKLFLFEVKSFFNLISRTVPPDVFYNHYIVERTPIVFNINVVHFMLLFKWTDGVCFAALILYITPIGGITVKQDPFCASLAYVNTNKRSTIENVYVQFEMIALASSALFGLRTQLAYFETSYQCILYSTSKICKV